MSIQGYVFYKNQMHYLQAEAASVAGIPKIEIHGLTRRDERKITEKLKFWLRRHQIPLLKNRRVFISLSRDFHSHIIGMDLIAWMSLLEIKGNLKNHEECFFSGDYDLQGIRRKDNPLESHLMHQRNLNIEMPIELPSFWVGRKGNKKLGNHDHKREKILIINANDNLKEEFLLDLQKKENLIIEKFQAEHYKAENRSGKILYCDLSELTSGEKELLNKVLSQSFLREGLVVFTNLCPCGKRGLKDRFQTPCQYAKSYCFQNIKALRAFNLKCIDSFLDLSGTSNRKQIFMDLSKIKQKSLSKANQELLRQKTEV